MGGLGIEVGGSLRLSHDLIREAAAASLPASARRRLHARLADWIEASAGDDVKLLREALDHRVAAGQPSAELALRLVASPGRRLLNADDLRLLASISDGLDPGSPAQLRIDRGLGELGAVIGEVDLALERWARVSEQSADPSERRDAETEAAQTAYRFGRREVAHEHIDRARALSTADLEATVRLDALQADVELWLDHETAAGSRTAERAVAAAEEMAAASGEDSSAFRLRPARRISPPSRSRSMARCRRIVTTTSSAWRSSACASPRASMTSHASPRRSGPPRRCGP